MYNRADASRARVAAEWDSGVTWIAYPEEGGQRASHAIETTDGVWLIDPLDAPNLDEVLSEFGDVVGVAVLFNYHARDAGALARKHDVAVHIPEWMGRVEERVDAPIERYTLSPDDEIQILPRSTLPGWEEVFWYHEPSGTLAVGDTFGTTSAFLIEDERLGLEIFHRLRPPEISELEPQRVLVGHGEPITEDASEALDAALDGARRSFPTALVENGAESVRAFAGALLD